MRICVKSAFLSAGLVLALAPQFAGAQAEAPLHAAPSPERLNVLARTLLDAAMKVNGIDRNNAKPWHIKIDFDFMPGPTAKKPETGTVEEWHASQYQWRRTYTGTMPSWNGSEWSAAHTERYATKPRHGEFDDYFLNLRFTRPVIDPLYQVPNLRPQDPLAVQHVEKNGTAYNCTSLDTNPDGKINGAKANAYVPAYCFDKDLHLRVVQSDQTTVLFDDYQPFQGKSVAHQVKILFGSALMATMKVVQLESLDTLDEAMLKPAADAVLQPYVVEPGFPQPVSVYEEGRTIPLLPNGQPFRGTLAIPIIIHKDGSVSLQHQPSMPYLQNLLDAAYGAVAKWKYKPYLVDGQPVEAVYNAPYPVDGKPFVPSYERSGNDENLAPSTANHDETQASGVPRPRRGR